MHSHLAELLSPAVGDGGGCGSNSMGAPATNSRLDQKPNNASTNACVHACLGYQLSPQSPDPHKVGENNRL